MPENTAADLLLSTWGNLGATITVASGNGLGRLPIHEANSVQNYGSEMECTVRWKKRNARHESRKQAAVVCC